MQLLAIESPPGKRRCVIEFPVLHGGEQRAYNLSPNHRGEVGLVANRADDAFPHVVRLRLADEIGAELRQLGLAVKCHHEPDQVAHHARFVTFAPQLVIDVVEALGCGIASVAPAPLDSQHATVHQSAQASGDSPSLHARPTRDFAGGAGLPKVQHGGIDPSFALGQAIHPVAEVFGVGVDKRNEFLHEFPHGPVPRELRHDHEQARAAAGQDFERTNVSPGRLVAADGLP